MWIQKSPAPKRLLYTNPPTAVIWRSSGSLAHILRHGAYRRPPPSRFPFGLAGRLVTVCVCGHFLTRSSQAIVRICTWEPLMAERHPQAYVSPYTDYNLSLLDYWRPALLSRLQALVYNSFRPVGTRLYCTLLSAIAFAAYPLIASTQHHLIRFVLLSIPPPILSTLRTDTILWCF